MDISAPDRSFRYGVCMSIHSLAIAASEAVGESGEHSETSPFLYGGVALVVLLLALFVVTRFNIDR